MREIKFRAWDSYRKKMCYDIEIDIYGEWSGQWYFSNGDKDCFFDKDIEGSQLMQFSGLKDKDGKDIYEGDILETNVMLSETGEKCRSLVRFLEGSFIGNGLMSNDPIYINNFQPEVIGNIYETPELLTTK